MSAALTQRLPRHDAGLGHLQVLGVAQTASSDEIRVAYRKLALQWHPDKHRGDDAEAAADRFKDIATAYSVLRFVYHWGASSSLLSPVC